MVDSFVPDKSGQAPVSRSLLKWPNHVSIVYYGVVQDAGSSPATSTKKIPSDDGSFLLILTTNNQTMSKFGSLLMMSSMAENDAKLFDSGHHWGPVPYRSAPLNKKQTKARKKTKSAKLARKLQR